MIQRSYSAWLVPFAFTLIGFGSGTAKAIAQTTTLPFEAIYNIRTTFRPITLDVLEGTDVGESAYAPYGLTNLMGLDYIRIDPETGVWTVDTNPAKFGLVDSKIGFFEFKGSGSDRLFGTSSGTFLFNFEEGIVTGSSTINITGGEGQFRSAQGILGLFINNTINPDPTAPNEVLISGSFDVPEPVPEPTASGALIGAVAIGILFRRHRHLR
jgi:hypothetical protein